MSTAASPSRSDHGEPFVVMGVAGSGKSVVGAALAARLHVAFADGDVFHPEANVAKMMAGAPLDDDDRWPWLDRIGRVLAEPGSPGVIACSALRRVYRDHLVAVSGRRLLFVHLTGHADLLGQRIKARAGHFMPPSLLGSQVAVLEPPRTDENAIVVDVDRSVDAIVDEILSHVKGNGS